MLIRACCCALILTGLTIVMQSSAHTEPWTPLFDGKSLAGWRGYRQPDASSTRWRIEDGALTVDASGGEDTRGKLDIITTATYDAFELEWKWKLAPGANSGLKYFVLEDRDAAIGHEYQMLDDDRHADAKVGAHRRTASFYDVLAPEAAKPRPAGEFNESRIVVSHRRNTEETQSSGLWVEHWLNGTRVLQYELGSAALQAAIEKSKFKGIERFGKPQKGHILLQDHGDRVWVRDMRIRILS
jgi:hypothetical protein